MKKWWMILLTAISLITAGCLSDTSQPSEPRMASSMSGPAPGKIAAKIDSLQRVNVRLTQESKLMEEFLLEYTRLINEAVVGLDALTEREGMMQQLRLDLNARESGGDVQGVRSIERRIQDNLMSLDKFIQESKQLRASFASKQAELNKMKKEHALKVEELEQVSQRLRGLIEKKERAIAGMRDEAHYMLARITQLTREKDNLQRANNHLTTQNNELRQAYYLVGSLDELKSKGVVDRVGGFLRIGSRTNIQEFNPKQFLTTTIETKEISLGPADKRYKVLSNHRSQAALFAMEARGETMYLAIQNPEEFWMLSRFLVIEAN